MTDSAATEGYVDARADVTRYEVGQAIEKSLHGQTRWVSRIIIAGISIQIGLAVAVVALLWVRLGG